MRPNINISHTLNGRVKDYAEANDLSLDEAYIEALETDVSALKDAIKSENSGTRDVIRHLTRELGLPLDPDASTS